MPSIVVTNAAASGSDPYKIKAIDNTPVMGSFADMWGVRQESDIILEDGMQKRLNGGESQSDDMDHTIRVLQHNPYSLTNPLTQVYSCTCGHCSAPATVKTHLADTAADPHYVTEDGAAVEETLSRFMPPPPPRVDTYDVLAACGAVDPDTVVYQMMVRWFSKTERAQTLFDVDCPCPSPSPSEYSFAEWCTMVNEWWYRNFEHRQKKQHRSAAGHHLHQW